MRLISLELESKLREKRLWPQSWIAWAAIYVLALDLLLFAVQWLTHASPAISASLNGWVIFLSLLAIVLLALAGFRWLRSLLLWRLRNRLIVTYVFIGVIPVFLLVVISLITLYLSCRAIRQFRCNFRHRHSSAQHGSSQPSHRPSPFNAISEAEESWTRKSSVVQGHVVRNGRGGSLRLVSEPSRSLTAPGPEARSASTLRRSSRRISATL